MMKFKKDIVHYYLKSWCMILHIGTFPILYCIHEVKRISLGVQFKSASISSKLWSLPIRYNPLGFLHHIYTPMPSRNIKDIFT